MNPKQLLDNLSTHLKNAIGRAIAVAASLRHEHVTLVHLLLGLVEEQGSVAGELLKKNGITKELLLEKIGSVPLETIKKRGETATTAIPELNQYTKKALERAMLVAYEREHTYIGTEHLLYGLLQAEEPELDDLFADLGKSIDDIEDEIDHILESTSQFPDIEDVSTMLEHFQSMLGDAPLPGSEEDLPSPAPAEKESREPKGKKQSGKPSALQLFAVELTGTERQASIDPVIGRDSEIERLLHILCRRNKNNPVLVGEPGVGKTAIVEGLAKKICEGDVPEALQKKKIYSLDLTLLISGTMYRGEFEARLKQLIDECAARPDVILFIDEIHNIIGAGSNQGTMDAANILKPALARGQLRCIGATTFDEYKKFIANDPALERRFQEITVSEPSTTEAIQILSGIKKFYETFHRVAIDDAAIESAVLWSSKYIHDNFLPDKAIDLVDEASAAARLHAKPDAQAKQIRKLEQSIEEEERKKEEAILAEQFEAAIEHKEKAEKLKTALASAQKKPGKQKNKSLPVTTKEIAEVLSRRLHIDPALILAGEHEQLETLEGRLGKHVVGQDAAIHSVVEALRQAHFSPHTKGRPYASLLFTGPSGVGKTKLAEALAKELFFNETSLIRIDMSEFAEAHGVSKLLGSPAGYVGYKERNRFLDALRSRPYSVVLFDEFDKAHGDVQKLLYQILDEGTLTDSAGKKVSFKHAIVILTSNSGADILTRGGFGFGRGDVKREKELEAHVLDKLKEDLGAAFLGRVGRVVVFHPLSEEQTIEIARRHIETINQHLRETKQLSITPEDAALLRLARAASDKEVGIRNLEHIVDDTIYSLLLAQKKVTKKHYRLSVEEERYTLL